jgi:hypothetical protein
MFAYKLKEPRSLVAVGMSCLVIALVLPEFFHPASQSSINATHFFRGLFLGISIVLNLAAARLSARQRRLRTPA